jgi:hypothetical protein
VNSLKARRAGLLGSVAIVILALAETAVALIAPLRAPSDADWRAAAEEVRGGFRAGDLIVSAPAWADAILRVHLGDLIPAEVAGRLDDERFGRVWEVGQRGAEAAAAARGDVTRTRRFGALTVRLVERAPEPVRYDFVERWTEAQVSRRDGAGNVMPCPNMGDRFQCPDISYNFVRRQMVEVDTRLRRALLAQPVPGATVAVEFSAVELGRSLVVAAGLHNVWMRKEARGPVDLRVTVGTGPAAAQTTFTTRNDDGWKHVRVDTSAFVGQRAPVRFEIASPAPYARHFAFAAEARQ